jgi:hypothetical protein
VELLSVVIGHIQNGHRMNRNYLAIPQGDAFVNVLCISRVANVSGRLS